MNALFVYLFKSGTILIVFYSIYWLLFRESTHFLLNRIILTGTILVSLIFPFVYTDIFQLSQFEHIPKVSVFLNEVIIRTNPVKYSINDPGPLFFRVLWYIYLTGALFIFLKVVLQGMKLNMLIHRSNKIYINKTLKVYKTKIPIAPFVFLNKIFIPDKDIEDKALHTILMHENEHLRQFHMIDIILIQVLTIIQWFNPFTWLIEKSLKEVHEFLADEAVLKNGQNQGIYQAILVNQVMGGPVFSITNNFNHSLILKRILMMTKKRTSGKAQWKVLLFIPALLVLMLVFTNPAIKAESSSTSQQEPQKKEQTKDENSTIFQKVEQMPDFPGGIDKLMEYLKKNVKYPPEAYKKGISGKVFVQFIVTETGKIKDCKVIRGVDKLLDAEALRVINAMPNWKPGKENGKPVNVQMTIPVNFVLK